MPCVISSLNKAYPAVVAETSGSRAGLYLLAGVIILTAVLLRRSYRRFGRRSRRKNPDVLKSLREHLQIDVEQIDASAAIDRREIELFTLYRDCAARLDNKIIAIEHLLRQSEEIADRLDRLLKNTPKQDS